MGPRFDTLTNDARVLEQPHHHSLRRDSMGGRADIPIPHRDVELLIVLDHPTNEGNIGAIARSMLNFGLDRLRIIGPKIEWSDEARNRAKHAQKVLDGISFHEDWDGCMSDISIVNGTSGKREMGDKVQFRHFLLPEEIEERLLGASGRAAVVFGEEGSGLSNEQLQMCDLLLTIPTWEGYPILNLSHAVSIVVYEWFGGLVRDGRIGREQSLPKTVHPERVLSPELRRVLRGSVERLAISLPRAEEKRKGAAETLQRVLLRAIPNDHEAHRLIGMLDDASLALGFMDANRDLWDELRSTGSAERRQHRADT